MNSKEFAERLGAIEDEARQKIVDLVNEAQADEGLEWDTDMPISFYDDSNWKYKADALAELAGWIYDRTRGLNRLHKKSMTKKIRKALGYNQP